MKQHLLAKPDNTDRKIGGLLASFNRKIRAYPPGMCPLTVQLSLLHASKSLTCGKCVPCGEGLVQLEELLQADSRRRRQHADATADERAGGDDPCHGGLRHRL